MADKLPDDPALYSRGIQPDRPLATRGVQPDRPPLGPDPLAALNQRRLEVLLMKSVVDPEFLELFVKERGEAAARVGLALTPAEMAMLRHTPEARLREMVKVVKVPSHMVEVLRGSSGPEMLAALGAAATPGEDELLLTKGIQPDRPSFPVPPPRIPVTGIRPDIPIPIVRRVPRACVPPLMLVILILASLAILLLRWLKVF
jgi:hypothetical protein